MTRMNYAAALTIVATVWCASANLSAAQIVASEHAALSQTIDGTVIDIAYSRPSLRGRTDIFNTEVPRDVLWTPGADSATTISFNKDVTIEGTEVPAGRYSLWMITAHGDWEVVLDSVADKFHVPHPERMNWQISFKVTPDTLATETMQSLVFYFPTVRSDGATLRMQWERSVVDMNIDVQPTRVLTISEEDAAPFLGHYAVDIPKSEYSEAHSFELDLVYSGEYLSGALEFDPSSDPMDAYFAPAGDQIFNPVWVLNGTVASIIDEVFFEFSLDEAGRAVSFDARGLEDDIWMSGHRVDDNQD